MRTILPALAAIGFTAVMADRVDAAELKVAPAVYTTTAESTSVLADPVGWRHHYRTRGYYYGPGYSYRSRAVYRPYYSHGYSFGYPYYRYGYVNRYPYSVGYSGYGYGGYRYGGYGYGGYSWYGPRYYSVYQSPGAYYSYPTGGYTYIAPSSYYAAGYYSPWGVSTGWTVPGYHSPYGYYGGVSYGYSGWW